MINIFIFCKTKEIRLTHRTQIKFPERKYRYEKVKTGVHTESILKNIDINEMLTVNK